MTPTPRGVVLLATVFVLFAVACAQSDRSSETVPQSNTPSTTSDAADAPARAEAEALGVIEAAYEAYNTGDGETWWQMTGALAPYGSSEEREHWYRLSLEASQVAFGFGAHLAAECVSSGYGTWSGLTTEPAAPTVAGYLFTCDTVETDRFHDAANLELDSTIYWVVDNGAVVAVSVEAELGDPETWNAFRHDFERWIRSARPEIRETIELGPLTGAPVGGSISTVLGLVDEFVADSPYWPRSIDAPLTEPVSSGFIDGVEVFNADAAQLELVAWAFSRFEQAELAPPPALSITFPPARSCRDRLSGAAIHAPSGVSIEVCTDAEQLAGVETFPRAARRGILHELAHAWTDAYVDEARRDRFLELRGLAAWSGVAWQESGSEQAAEVVMWGLLDEAVVPRVPDPTCTELASAYTTLTARSPDTRRVECPTNH